MQTHRVPAYPVPGHPLVRTCAAYVPRMHAHAVSRPPPCAHLLLLELLPLLAQLLVALQPLPHLQPSCQTLAPVHVVDVALGGVAEDLQR